ncbi:MAG: LPS export ABC transporter permease LptF [Thiogranum sp.]
MILERYLYQEVLEKLLWIIGLLILILTSNRFVDYLADAAAGNLPSELILQMLFSKMMSTVPRLLPITIFLAVILALSRLSRDNELTIFMGAGLGQWFQVLSVTKFALAFSIPVAIASFYIAPWAESQVADLKARARTESDISGITAGQFKEFSEGDRIVYVERLAADKGSMENVFLQVRQDQKLGVLAASSARYVFADVSGSRYILFKDGRRYVGKPGMLDYQIIRYRSYGVLIEETDQTANTTDLDAVPTKELIGSGLPKYKAELQWRLSYLISTLVLPLLAIALNRFSYNERRYVPVFVAILVYFVYSNMLGISKTLLKRDDIPAFIGLWWVHLLMLLLIALILNFQSIRYRLTRGSAVQILPAQR